MTIARVVVVGGGLSGLRTVEELRSQGYQGVITLIGAERRPPYDRPPLSKQLMSGTVDDTTLRADLSALGARILLGERATGLGEQVLRTDRGEHGFEALVLATGAQPVALPGPGRQRLLRTMDDALELRALLRPGLRLVIVGAGWIGAELATAAAARGSQVTVVEASAAPLLAAVGAEIGARTEPWYAAAGVSLRLGQAVDSVQPGGLALAGGGWLEADEIVTAVGVRPTVSWLASSAVQVDRGVVVDEQLRTSVPGVFAAGDCAAFWSRRYQRRLAVRALGHRAARARGGRGQRAGRQRRVRSGALLLVRAVRPDAPIRRLSRRRGPAGVAGRSGGRRLDGLLAGGWRAGRGVLRGRAQGSAAGPAAHPGRPGDRRGPARGSGRAGPGHGAGVARARAVSAPAIAGVADHSPDCFPGPGGCLAGPQVFGRYRNVGKSETWHRSTPRPTPSSATG